MTKIAGSGSGSISQRHGSPDPDPPQNVMVTVLIKIRRSSKNTGGIFLDFLKFFKIHFVRHPRM
jgi:hypothetical protein